MIPKRVIIVGAGRTAWMAAAYLRSALGRAVPASPDITVIEPSVEPLPGPGLAAAPTLKHLLDVIGIDEISLLNRVGGTFRQATKYENWLRGTGDFFYHPIDDARAQPIDRAALQWLMSDRSIAFAETVSPQPVICDLGLAPKPMGGAPTALPLKYAYHVNDSELAELLREVATSSGVKHCQERFADLEIAENGEVVAIRTEGGARLEADLYIDCSGSAALLGKAQSRVEWVDCTRWLLCDREIRMDIDYSQYYPGRVRPFTTATALSSGWLRDIPLQGLRTLGYVHSSRHIDEADASRELRGFEGRHASPLGTYAVQLEAGHRATPWARNCVSLGSSAAVIEPLASADQYLDDLGIIALAEHFPVSDDFEPNEFRYNRIMTNRYYELLDFVNLHYALTKRSDSDFWRDARKPERINDRLQAKLEFWQQKVPSKSDFVDQHLPGQPDMPFGELPGAQPSPVDTGAIYGLESYEAVLYGMQFLADECNAWFGVNRSPTRVPAYIMDDLQRAPAMLPPHDTWLRKFAGMASYPATGAGQL
jgi:tryptophan halogenase